MLEDSFIVPQDLSLVQDQELAALEVSAVAEFDRIQGLEDFTPDDVASATQLTSDIDRIRAEMAGRDAKRLADEEAARFRLAQQRDALAARVHGTPVAPEGGDGGSGTDPAPAQLDVNAMAAAVATATTTALMERFGEAPRGSRTGPTLSGARQFAPRVIAPSGDTELAVTASVDIPGVATGAGLTTLDSVVDAFQKRSRGLPVTSNGRVDGGPRVVTIRQSYPHVIDDRSSPATVEELMGRLINTEKIEALVAGGGWCAPSENLYNFFNVTCTDGLVDLPTVGVSRGGIRFPTSPSLADVFSGTFSNSTNPWLWTETDDILTVTGSTNKPCVRVPCPSFNESRLECYGICLTAGNLTDDAYPEATSNYLRLLLAAHEHAMNQRYLQTMVSLSSAMVSGADFNVDKLPITNQLLGATALAGMDYRARYGMCDTDVLEVVMPQWAREMIRADLAWRTNVEMLDVSNAQIDGYFQLRRIAPQWVADWQVRASGLPGFSTATTAWPDNVDFLIYAPGTFLKGNGLTLDLGVVRDSVLNAENDHTAAWTEQCHLIAKVGYESRQFRVAISANGGSSTAILGIDDRL